MQGRRYSDTVSPLLCYGDGRHNLDVDLEPDLTLVLADRRRIVQALGNLLSNAARNSPEWSVIRVSAAREGLHVAISVADEGSGIAADRLPRLFGKAYPAGEDGGQRDVGTAFAMRQTPGDAGVPCSW